MLIDKAHVIYDTEEQSFKIWSAIYQVFVCGFP